MALLIVPGQAANFFPVFNSSDYKAPFEVNVTHLQRYTCLSASKVSQRIKVLAPDSPRVTWTGQATPLAIQIMRVSKARKRYDTYSFLSFQMLLFFSIFFFRKSLCKVSLSSYHYHHKSYISYILLSKTSPSHLRTHSIILWHTHPAFSLVPQPTVCVRSRCWRGPRTRRETGCSPPSRSRCPSP